MPFVDAEDVMLKKMDDENEKEISEISEIIENSDIGENDKERIIGIIRSEEFKGPIPHPQILRQYEELQSGLANVIVDMAIKEQAHRHEMDTTIVQSEVLLNTGHIEVIRASIKLKTRLQIFGFVLTTALLAIGATCIFLDKNVESIVPIILAVGSFCWTMFYGKSKSDEGDKEQSDESE